MPGLHTDDDARLAIGDKTQPVLDLHAVRSELALRPRSSLQEASTHAALLDCAQSFSPCVEDSACDTALLDLRGMASLFGSIHNISRAISERAIALGLQANVAIASNSDG